VIEHKTFDESGGTQTCVCYDAGYAGVAHAALYVHKAEYRDGVRDRFEHENDI
jgi:hypothetical protein